MTNQSLEINGEYLKPRTAALNLLINMLFIFIVIFPLAINKVTFVYNLLLPYAVATWLYFSETKYYFLKKNLQPLSFDKHELIQRWLENANVKDVSILYYTGEKIEANAFGTHNHQYIAISQKALDSLSAEELKMLVLHEAGHHAYGDSWKYCFARYLALSVFVAQIIWGILAVVSSNVSGRNLFSQMFVSLPNFLSVFVYAIAALSILYMTRLRELLADDFAMLRTNDQKSFMDLFAKLSIDQRLQIGSKSIAQFKPPKLFNYHPSGKDRLMSILSPGLMFEEIYPLLLLAGLVTGAFIGLGGNIPNLILFSFPVVCASGSFLLYYVIMRFGVKKDYGKLTFAYSSSAALSLSIFNFVWSSALVYGETGAMRYYLAPIQKIMSDAFLIFDNYLLIISLGSLYIIVVSFLLVKTRILVGYLFPKTVFFQKMSILALWSVLLLTLSYFWLDMFGPYPFLLYLYF